MSHSTRLSLYCVLAFSWLLLLGVPWGFAQTAEKLFLQDPTLEAALAEAKKQKKPLFVDFMATWCGPCKWMDAKVFSVEGVQKALKTNYVAVKIDVDSKTGKIWATKFKITAMPTLAILNDQGEELFRQLGAVEAEPLQVILKEALQPENQRPYLASRYKANTATPSELRNYVKMLANAGEDALFQEVFAKYLAVLPAEDRLLPEHFELLYAMTQMSEEHELMQYLQANVKRAIELNGGQAVTDVYTRLVYEDFQNAAMQQEEAEARALADKVAARVPHPSAQVRTLELMLTYHQISGDFEAFYAISEEMMLNIEYVSPLIINKIAWEVYEKASEMPMFKNAHSWIVNANKREPSYPSLDTQMALELKLGLKDQARDTAKRAIKAAEAEGENYEGTLILLRKYGIQL